MKLIGTGVLGGLVALAAVALLGATSASATTLCKAKEEVCAAGNRYPAGTAVKATAVGTAKFPSSIGTVECKESSAEGKSNEESTGSPETALDVLVKFSFTSCLLGKTACTVEVPRAWLILFLFLSLFPFFHVKIDRDPSLEGNANIHMKCGFLINCTYGAENILLEGESGAPASLVANEAELAIEAGFCPEKMKWSAKYEVTAPNPLWVAPEP